MSRRSTRIIKMLLRWLCTLLCLSAAGILIVRILLSGDPKEMSALSVNERTLTAYREYGEEWNAYGQKQLTLTRAEYEVSGDNEPNFKNKNNYGYFGVTQSVIIEEAKQVQLVFRYNNGTIKHLKEDYELPEMPKREAHLYDVSLVLAIDLTPENEADNFMNPLDPESVLLVRVQPDADVTERATKNLYNYYRYVFDLPEEINMDRVLAMFVDVYYVEDISYLSEDADIYTDMPYGTLCIYDYVKKTVPYKLSSRDKAVLEGKN